MSERPKEHASKACEGNPLRGFKSHRHRTGTDGGAPARGAAVVVRATDFPDSSARVAGVRLRALRVHRSWVGPALVISLGLTVLGAGAVASLETGTVHSFWKGLWWSISLMTTVGFIGQPPQTVAGVLVSVVLMVCGFVLLALVSAALASLFVREEAEPSEAAERAVDRQILEELRVLNARVRELERRLAHDVPVYREMD